MPGPFPSACFISQAPSLGLKKELYQMIPKQIPQVLTCFDPVNGRSFLSFSFPESSKIGFIWDLAHNRERANEVRWSSGCGAGQTL